MIGRAARRLGAAALLAGVAALLSGCVAAAIPLAAGAALATTRGDQDAPAPGAKAMDASDMTIVPAGTTALPTPTPPVAADNGVVSRFAAYAGAALEGSRPRDSALLVKASALKPVRAPCRGRPPAVFIDLDPGKSSFDPLTVQDPAPGLATALAGLRERGIAVVWFTRLGENFSQAVRGVLAGSGVDPASRDILVLMRDIGERKQTRRDEIAQKLCPVAILGDERSDFDELYLYLRDADAAIPLDIMIGRGWFLAAPLSPKAS
ncbi:hypothetical protein [Qipengyuania sediminis]|uniref:hypothetical protein n=1 Tax=Qipengyuania sediminis TaxID=1532023 RepID=UPI00105A2059|nr:hypothetical protein [Qipengyuania sediminis]